MKEIENSFLRGFIETPAARRIVQKCARSVLNPNEVTIDGELAGKVFQEIAYEYTAARISEYFTLLSPDDTLDFFSDLYPSKVKRRNKYNLTSLMGVAVPDGLLYDQRLQQFPENPDIISALYEYTLVSDLNSYLNSKVYAIRKILGEFPSLFGEAEIVFVIPHGRDKAKGLENFGTIKTLPFTSKEFSVYLRNFANQIRAAV